MRDDALCSIERDAVRHYSSQYPGCALHFTHRFLDGRVGNEWGFVPHAWNGRTVEVGDPWITRKT